MAFSHQSNPEISREDAISQSFFCSEFSALTRYRGGFWEDEILPLSVRGPLSIMGVAGLIARSSIPEIWATSCTFNPPDHRTGFP
jgi:hypothetical protein